MIKKSKPQIYVVLGPTASGKSDYAVKLAKKINGEIISLDSRQTYKHLDIGSGKITKSEMKGVPHYCLDIVDPIKASIKYAKTKQNFSAQEYLKFANRAVREILAKKKVPILTGGTGFYLDAILYGLPRQAKLNSQLRLGLEKESLGNLLKKIKSLNQAKYLELMRNPSEQNNQRRLIRIIEILENKKLAGKEVSIIPLKRKTKYTPTFIFMERSKEELQARIKKRLEQRLHTKSKKNLITELKFLRERLKINDDWLLSLGLEYRFVTLYLEGKITYEQMREEIQNKSWQYAKRQILWNKRYKNTILKLN